MHGLSVSARRWVLSAANIPALAASPFAREAVSAVLTALLRRDATWGACKSALVLLSQAVTCTDDATSEALSQDIVNYPGLLPLLCTWLSSPVRCDSAAVLLVALTRRAQAHVMPVLATADMPSVLTELALRCGQPTSAAAACILLLQSSPDAALATLLTNRLSIILTPALASRRIQRTDRLHEACVVVQAACWTAAPTAPSLRLIDALGPTVSGDSSDAQCAVDVFGSLWSLYLSFCSLGCGDDRMRELLRCLNVVQGLLPSVSR